MIVLPVMSLVSTIQQAVQSYKEEEAKLISSIQLLKGILKSLACQAEERLEDPLPLDSVAADPDVPPEENDDMELLDRALEKALRIRTGMAIPNKEPGGKNLIGAQKKTHSSKDASHLSTASKQTQKEVKLTSKSVKVHKRSLNSNSANSKPGKSKSPNNRKTIPNHARFLSVRRAASKPNPPAVLASAHPDEITTSLIKTQPVRSNEVSGDGPSRAASASLLSGDGIVLEQKRLASGQRQQWTSLRSKQDRLWDKVVTVQRKAVPGRNRFMERMRATFPRDWPCGSPDQTRTLLNRLTHRGLDLAQQCQTEELLAKRAGEMATHCGAERLLMKIAEFQISANQIKEEWKSWDGWRPEGGCLCPAGTPTTLPPTVTYRTEAELHELERLRMKVALLQQENHLEQVLLDTLSPQISSLVPGPEAPDPSVLRDVFSLLGEGGERFPAIILDSDPE